MTTDEFRRQVAAGATTAEQVEIAYRLAAAAGLDVKRTGDHELLFVNEWEETVERFDMEALGLEEVDR